MSHADTLRGMAGLSYSAADALLAGANALDTLDRVRGALTEIDRLEDDAWDVWERDADMFEQGRSDAYFHVHTIITEALGDTL